jgi:hypothetical protein
MSEYQYYEFQALDRPLTEAELRTVRSYSTRATISPSRFMNSYHWGNFKGDELAWMERYYDAFLYLANWGTHRLMFRLPRRLLDLETARRYCPGDVAKAHGRGDFVILEFLSRDEEGTWDEVGEDDGRLAAFLPLRQDLAAGDLRALYLGWLLCVQEGLLEDDEVEPPCPPGLRSPSAALGAFCDFLRIDRDLIETAAMRSPDPDAESREELTRWVAALPEAEKSHLLVRLAFEGGAQLQAEIWKRFRESRKSSGKNDSLPPRTVTELLDAAARRTEERRREEEEREAQERARRDRAIAEIREKHLTALAKREVKAWQEVDSLMESKLPRNYQLAVALLTDLRDLGNRTGEAEKVRAKTRLLCQKHSRKWSLVQKLKEAGLWEE